jgi:hypothetical protein
MTMMNLGLVAAEPGHALTLEHPVVANWMFAREMFRRLGFEAENLWMASHAVTDDVGAIVENVAVIGVVLRTQDKEFEWAIGLVEASTERLAVLYEEWVATWNAGNVFKDKGTWLDIFFTSWAFDKRWELLAALQADGFVIPKVDPGR